MTSTDAVFKFIKSFTAKNGYPPTRDEISEHMGWASSNAAHYHITKLVKDGRISVSRNLSRGIMIL